MSIRLADRLDEARHQQFVGREAELELFSSALAASELPFFILYIFGPGGVGKTSLLREFRYLGRQVGVQTTYLDMRDVPPSPQTFIDTLRLALGLSSETSLFETLSGQTDRHIIMIDTYETLAPLGSWLRQVFLPQLSENILVVLAGRDPSSLTWRTDSGWRELIHTIALRNFSQEESEAFLDRRQVPVDHYQVIFDFTHGHPLALSLIADEFAQRDQPLSEFKPEAAPDMIKTLLDRFVQDVPSSTYRAALEACAQVRLMTEPLLATMLAIPEADEIFEWLRRLSFVESKAQGVYLHDLAGKTLAVDLRWRNADLYQELLKRARTYYRSRLPLVNVEEQQRLIVDYIYLHRHNPVVQPFISGSGEVAALVDVAHDSDWPALTKMVARHEGETSAALAARWFKRQPQGVIVIRSLEMDAEAGPLGFLMTIALEQAQAESLAVDPATQMAWNYLTEYAPLRSGEKASLFRFWMAGDTYQHLSPTQALIGVNMVRHYLTTPGLAFTFFPCADPDFWAPLCAYANLKRIPEADFVVDDRHYGVYGHDWRVVPPLKWLDLMAERETMLTAQAPLFPAVTESLVVLSRSEFEKAVRQALRDFSKVEALHTNPLLHSRLVARSTEMPLAERVARLQRLLQAASKTVESSPRQVKFYRALYHTYLNPAPTQEKAAETLNLPFSTYRRHLKAGIIQVTNLLWQQEIGASEV